MSSTGIQKLLSQTMNKKRKSCFEITRVAFQNLSEDETDDDENASKHCSNCESFLPKENLQTSREDVSARTRFKVLKAAYIRGRWNCNDSLEDEGEFYLDDVNSGKYEIGDPEHKNSLDVFQSSISVLNFSECKTSTHSRSLMAESRHTFPDLLDHQVNHSSKDIQIIQTSDFGSTDCWGTLGHSSSSPLFLMKPDITNTCEKSDESCTVRIEVHPPLNNHASEDRSSHPNINVVSSSENISEKISKALDLAKEHVILTAHGEIEKLKDKIIHLQSTIKRLEEENMQLRGMTVEHQLETSASATADLIDLSDN